MQPRSGDDPIVGVDVVRALEMSPTHAPQGRLRIGAVTSEWGLRAIERPWRELFARVPDATPFQSFEWQAAWWKHAGAGTPWILTAYRGAELVALMPLVLARGRGSPLRRVRFAGAPPAGVHDLLTLPRERETAAKAFLAQLARESRRWDLCDLDGLASGRVLATLAPADLEVERASQPPCSHLPLAPSWDAFLERLGPQRRIDLERRRERLARSFRVDLVTVDGEAAAPSAMAALLALVGDRWRRRGLPGTAAPPRPFHHDVAQRFATRGWLRLYLLRLDGVVAAGLGCVQLGDRVHGWLEGVAPEVRRFAPGAVLQAYALERAIASGATGLELAGDGARYWPCETRPRERLVIGSRTNRSRLLAAVVRVERWLARA
jgi:CelD/BcsL family acetyltransferase involved in cellulose biosynthesis